MVWIRALENFEEWVQALFLLSLDPLAQKRSFQKFCAVTHSSLRPPTTGTRYNVERMLTPLHPA